nr:unnamed protein product [Callosobruchus chinensis]
MSISIPSTHSYFGWKANELASRMN